MRRAENARSRVALLIELHRQRKRIGWQAARLAAAQRAESDVRVVELRLASERRYRALADAMPHIVWTARPDGTVDYFNRRWFECTGLSAEEAAGTWLGAVHPDDRARCESAWQKARSWERPFQIECRLRAGSAASFRWHVARALPQSDASGKIESWIGTFTDIEDQRRVAEKLAEFTGTLDAVHDAVLIFDASNDCRVLFANKGAQTLLGRSPEELLEMRPSDFFVDYDESSFGALVAALDRQARKPFVENTRCRRKGGAEVPVEASFQFICPDDGRVVALARDVTGRKVAELEREHLYEEAVAAVRARDAFLTVASHEFRGPLSALGLRLETLRRTSAPEARDASSAKQLHARVLAASNQVGRLTALVDELLDISRVSAGQLDLKRRTVDLGELARHVIDRFEDDARKAGTTVDLRAEEPVTGQWDPVRIEQVIANLVSNALKFGAGKPIDLTVCRSERGARMTVRDRGIGIAREDIGRVFDRFERATAAATHPGFGMGLYLARRIVEAHGGTIHAESEPDVGTTLTVDLPM